MILKIQKKKNKMNTDSFNIYNYPRRVLYEEELIHFHNVVVINFEDIYPQLFPFFYREDLKRVGS